MSSGAGAGAIPNFPQGTFNTLVGNTNGSERIYSEGRPAGGGDSLFANNDLIRTDNEDRVLVTNSDGNVVRVNTDGSAELIWPGDDGVGGLESVGGYSNLTDDNQGNLWIRGSFADAPSVSEQAGALRLINNNELVTAAAGMRGWSGITWDTDGKAVYIANKTLIVKLSSADGRTIAENLLSPPAPTGTEKQPTNMASHWDSPPVNVAPVDYDKAQIDWSLLQPKAETPAPETQTSGGGALGWLIMLTTFIFFNRRRYIK